MTEIRLFCFVFVFYVKGVLLRYFDCHDCEKPVGGRPYLPLVEELDREVIIIFFSTQWRGIIMAAQVVHTQPVPGATYYPQAVPNVIYVSY